MGMRIFILFIIMGLVTPVFADPQEGSTRDGTERVSQVMDAVLQNHIDSPVRQQLLLAGAKGIYRRAKLDPPRNLSSHISRLASSEEIEGYLNTLRGQMAEVVLDFDDQFIASMAQAVPGGMYLIPAEEARIQNSLNANRYVGVGIALAMDEGPMVARVIYDGPGWKAGLKPQDKILAIDGQATQAKDLKQILNDLRGEEGSVVTLKLQQPHEEAREIAVTRGITFIPTVLGSRELSPGNWQYTLDEATSIALLKISRIGPSTVHELKRIEASLRDTQLHGVILDLRQGGGTLHDVVMLADQLLEGGVIGFAKGVDSTVKHEARPSSLFRDIPMAVLVDSHANSDRVFLAAALQDHRRAVVIGEPNLDPVFIRSHVDLPSGDKLVMATGLLQRSDGTTLRKWSPGFAARQAVATLSARKPPTRTTPDFIMPDHVVRYPMANEQPALQQPRPMDPMVAKAVTVLKSMANRVPSEDRAESDSTAEAVSG